VGHPRQRMPVAGVTCLETPLEALPTETSVDVWIAHHITRIVKVDEIKTGDRRVKQPGANRKQQANQDGLKASVFSDHFRPD